MHLLHGFALDGCLPDYGHPRNMVNFPFRDDDDRRECWERNRDLLMGQFSEPFRRPDAWWSYDAPEPRRRTPAVYAFGPKGWTHYEPGTEGLFKPRDTEIIGGRPSIAQNATDGFRRGCSIRPTGCSGCK